MKKSIKDFKVEGIVIQEPIIKEAERFESYLNMDFNLSIVSDNCISYEFKFKNKYLEVRIKEKVYEVYCEFNQSEFVNAYKHSKLYEVINLLKLHSDTRRDLAVVVIGQILSEESDYHDMLIEIDEIIAPNFIVFGLDNDSVDSKDRLDSLLKMTFKYKNVLIFNEKADNLNDKICLIKNKYKFNEIYLYDKLKQ